MILDTEADIQREFLSVCNHLKEIKYALDSQKDTRSNRVLALIKKMEKLINEIEVP